MNEIKKLKIIIAFYTIGLYSFICVAGFSTSMIIFHGRIDYSITLIFALIGVLSFLYFRLHFCREIKKEKRKKCKLNWKKN